MQCSSIVSVHHYTIQYQAGSSPRIIEGFYFRSNLFKNKA